jgi:hypothetical protein
MTVSAISKIQRSGFELVKRRKTRGKLATMRDYAKADFKPLKPDKDMKPGELIPADKILLGCGVPARMAYAILLKTKDAVIAMYDRADIKIIDTLMVSMAEAAETLKVTVHVLDTAYLRVLAAAAAREVAKDKARG